MKKLKLKITKTTKIAIVAGAIMLAADWFYLRQVQKQPTVVEDGMPSFNQSELARYNGDDESLPIYLVLDGYVYDVSAGRADFYAPGQAYHDLVGKDSSSLLHLVGGDIIKRKYKIVGIYKL